MALVLLSVALGVGLLLVAPTPLGRQFRVLAHIDVPHRVLPAVVPHHAGGKYAFAKTQPGSDDPVTYDPCRPIPYVINPRGGPHDASAIISTAIARISAASGLEFEDRGLTDDTNFEDRDPGDPVLIGFVPAGSLEELTVASQRVGLGGSTAVTVDIGHLAYRTGMVALRSDWFSDPGVPEAQKTAVVMHELGHVLGLAHVTDTGELMSATNDGQTALGPGDREGLALLGRGECQ